MSLLRILGPAAVALALCSLSSETALAGPYPFGRPSGPAYRPAAAPVYGFQPSGQSFVYRQAGKGMYHTNTGSTSARPGYSPYYRFDAFTSPQARRSPPPIFAPPSYFGGRLWYPRPY